MFGELSKMYADREGGGTRALLFLGLPLTALTVYGAVLSAQRKGKLKEMPTKEGSSGVGIFDPTIQIPGLTEAFGAFGAVLPYVGISAVLLIGQGAVPKEWKVARTIMLVGGLGSAGLALWSGLAYGKKKEEEVLPEEVVAEPKTPIPRGERLKEIGHYIANFVRLEPEDPTHDVNWTHFHGHDVKVRVTNKGPDVVPMYIEGRVERADGTVFSGGKAFIRLGPGSKILKFRVPSPGVGYSGKNWSLRFYAYADPTIQPANASHPTIGVRYTLTGGW
jgi:hypothetical protein